jgi:HlyD family secretion protein
MSLFSKKTSLGVIVLTVCGLALTVGVCLFVAAGQQAPEASAANDPGQANGSAPDAAQVNVIRPRQDASFTMTVTEPAYVEAYNTSPLKAKVSGEVKDIHKAIGAPVKKDEVLAEIDVPDLVEAVKQAEKVVNQRQQEEKLAETRVKVAEEAKNAAASSLKVKQKLQEAARALMDFHYKRYYHLKGLADVEGITKLVPEEEEQKWLSARADYEAAGDAVDQAKARLAEAQRNLEASIVDVAYKHSLIEVARKDTDRAQALADYRFIRAPYDGVITKRHVDPGSFVDVGTAGSEPLFTIERADIVTVYMQVPDTFAPYVSEGTDAIISMSSLPGVLIHGKVTRFTPSLETSHSDLTMRVEVDLWNRSQRRYDAWIRAEEAKKPPATPYDDLNKTGPKPWPPSIKADNPNAPATRLLPGMYGTMQLALRNFQNAYLLPSDAILQDGGESYIYLLKDGKARKVPIEIQTNDGRLAKVALVVKKGQQLLHEELTGQEQVIYSNLGDLTDGEAVNGVPVNW